MFRPLCSLFLLSLFTLTPGFTQVREPHTITADTIAFDQPDLLASELTLPLPSLAVRRMAADNLELLRAQFPAWADARIADSPPTPFYRLDLGPDEPAYFEFLVEPQGYLVIATAEHDFPLARVNPKALQPLSHALMQAADLPLTQLPETRLLWLDGVSFAAENRDGALLALDGPMPAKIVHHDQPVEQAPLHISARAPGGYDADDNLEPGAEPEIEQGEQTDVTFTIEAWHDWQEVKSGYLDSFGPMLERLREAATKDWNTEILARELGDGIPLGSTLNVPLLSDDADFFVDGEGAQLAEVTRIQRDLAADLIRIQPFAAIEGADLQLHIHYGNGEAEMRTFFFVNTGSGKSGWQWLSGFRVGSFAEQRIYGQFNTNGCLSGCGAAAWAMVFGWADAQAAAGSAHWRKRWGLYRQNGGKGADAVAPSNMSTGIENVQKDLRAWMWTVCMYGEGRTMPTNMWRAAFYLSDRTGTRLASTWYPFFTGTEDAVRSMQTNGTPVVVGTGNYVHYPTAWAGFQRKRIVRHCFFACWEVTEYQWAVQLNNGWPGSYRNFEWITFNNHYLGEIFPD